nr:PDR/VanB family oxidoreductase [uncultured Duganella sp.]
MSYVISHIIPHGPAVKEFHLRRQDGAALPDWQPGAHIVLHFQDAAGAALERHYSLVGAAGATDTYRIAVQREDGGKGGSLRLHEAYAVGSEIGVSGPYNSFPLNADGARVLLIAGGIGITPLVSMAHALSAAGQPFELHYLARSAGRMVLLDELRALPHATIVPHVADQSGRVDLGALLGSYHDGDSLYSCGPAPLLQGLAEAGARNGWPAAAIHFESFGARTQQDDVPLTVELSLSEMTVEVRPGTSILAALLAADAFVSYDCQRGECGKCYTPVLEGQPLHRDICLTPEMRATGMCTCVSWAAAPGRLVLEL